MDSQENPGSGQIVFLPDMGAPVPFQVNETRHAGAAPEPGTRTPGGAGRVPARIERALSAVRVEAVAQTEARLTMEYEARSTGEADKIRQALELFQVETEGILFPR